MARRAAAALTGLVAALAACYQRAPLVQRELLDELRARGGSGEAGGRAGRGAKPIAPPVPLDPAAAVELAVEHNPDVRALRRARAVAEGEVVAASELAPLVVRLQAQQIRGDLPGSIGVGWQVQVRWSVPQPFVLQAREGRRRAELDEVRHEIAEREWQLAGAVRLAHAEVLAIDNEITLLSSAIENRKRILAAVHTRMESGASTRLDENVARLAVVQAERDREALWVDRVQAAQRLLRLMGTGWAELPVLAAGRAPPPAKVAASLDAAGLEERALAERHVLRAAQARYEAREQALRGAVWQRWPWFSLSAAPGYETSRSLTAPADLRLGIDVTLPFAWQRGDVLIAEARRDEERERTRALVAEVRAAIATARAEITARAQLVEHLGIEVLPVVDEQRRLVELALQAQQYNIVLLLRAEETALKMQRDHAQARLGYQKAWIDLDRAVGEAVSLAP